MKMRKFIFLSAVCWGTLVATNAFAVNLMDVYKQAVAADPKFKAAKAKFLADKQQLPISKAALFPNLSASGALTRQYSENENLSLSKNNGHYNNNIGYKLELTQPLFNFSNWAKVWGAQAVAKQAEATFLDAEEDLLTRTAQAYFDVLLAKDVLYYTKSNKSAYERLLNQAKHKHEVGLIAITDLEDARAKYDLAVSGEIAAVNDLSNKFEKLNEITGVRYLDLDAVKANFPLLSPQPTNIEKWTKAAEQQNFGLIAARYAAIAARENIKVANAGHLPTLNVNGGYNYSYDDNTNYVGSQIDGYNRTKSASAGVGITMPIFQGGGVVAAAKQADYYYQQQLAIQNQTHRTVVSNTRQTYLGVLSSISKIKADQQAIKSAQNALRATEASYTVGKSTMADVLTLQTQLYEAQKNFAEDEYKYIMQLLNLKSLTGILSSDDLGQINTWLDQHSSGTKRDETAVSKHHTLKPKSTSTPGSHAKSKQETKSHGAKNSVVATDKKTTNPNIVVFSASEVQQVDADNDVVAVVPPAAVVVKAAAEPKPTTTTTAASMVATTAVNTATPTVATVSTPTVAVTPAPKTVAPEVTTALNKAAPTVATVPVPTTITADAASAAMPKISNDSKKN